MTKLAPVAVDWSIEAMDDATLRVNQTTDPRSAFATIGEAVWWITVVDKTFENTAEYRLAVPPGQHASNVLAGLRSVRNRIGHDVNIVDFAGLAAVRADPGDGRIAAWVWQPVPPPVTNRLREQQNYEAYSIALEGRTVVEAFSIASGALRHIRALCQV